jgi:hypothetical protein
MNKNITSFALSFIVVVILSSFSSAHYNEPYTRYSYSNLNYYYYDGYDFNHEDSRIVGRLPVVAGPYDRYYLGFRATSRDYLYDDYNHFDTYRGYRDLDVFYPDERIDILRNPEGSLGPVDPNYRLTYNASRVNHVYGYLPNGMTYRKHYNHEHDWDLDYDYDYGYGYYESYSYSSRPVYTRNCYSNCN